MSMDDSRRLKDIATQFFADIAPRDVKELDRLFEHWKCGLPKKQEVNFGIALPPAMRERLLSDIGLADARTEPGRQRYIGWLHVLNRLMEKNIEDLLDMSPEDIIALIWKEGRRLGLRDPEIQELASVLPHWIQKISSKVIFEFSPVNVYEVSGSGSGGAAKSAPPDSGALFKGMIGRSEKMQSIFSCVERISSSNLSILIQGESGTGKELVAHAIHMNSSRANEPFIAVNCGALPDSIIESELFGYEKGAFTGAIGQKTGYFEIANRGTIFLDEISETSLHTQVKLLRVLQERKIRRVGGNKQIDIDIRVIAACNRDLPALVREARFRHDLYYRINEMTITLPPLRERQGDLPLLIDFFLNKFAQENAKPCPTVDASARRLLFGYSWPGNIRELENVLKRAVVLADKVIMPTHLPPNLADRPCGPDVALHNLPIAGSLEDQLMAAERGIITQALENNGQNVSMTAKVLKISRRTLQRKMKLLGIDRGVDPGEDDEET